MNKYFLMLFSWFGILVPAHGQDVIVRTQVSHQQAWQGEQVRLHIDVLAEEAWAQVNPLRLPEIPGAQVIRVETQGVRLNERINNANFTGTRYEILVFWQRSGVLTIPAQTLLVAATQWGQGETQYTTQTEEQHLEVVRPPGLTTQDHWVVTDSIVIQQSWESQEDQTEWRVGDAIRRRVTIKAESVAAMAIPPLVFVEPYGTDMYPASPRLSNKVNRGSLLAEREESVTYLFRQAGRIQLPNMEILGWNPKTQTLERHQLEGKVIDVLAAKNSSSRSSFALVVFMGLGVLLIAILIWQRHTLLEIQRALQAKYRQSEHYRWRRLKQCILERDPQTASQALMLWLETIEGLSSPPRFDIFARAYGEPKLYILYSTWFVSSSTSPTEQMNGFLKRLTRARKRYFVARKRESRIDSVLPPLN